MDGQHFTGKGEEKIEDPSLGREKKAWRSG